MELVGIGPVLRHLRENRGWTREALAYHAGLSWAAVAQIETGRRPDPRLSTLVALARALGVALDDLVGRTHARPSQSVSLVHRLLLYASDREFVETAVPFVTAEGGPPHASLVITNPRRMKQVRRAMAGGSAPVSFRDSAEWYRSPYAAFDAYRTFVRDTVGESVHEVRLVGEPWVGERLTGGARRWNRYESLLNLLFAGWPVKVLCAYDTRLVPEPVVAGARCSHPQLAGRTSVVENLEYRDPELSLLGERARR